MQGPIVTRHAFFLPRSIAGVLPAMLVFLSLAACSVIETPIQQRGHKVEADLLKELVPGTSSRADVTALLGSPTAQATFDDNTWIYVATANRSRIARYPTIEDQEVVVMKFDPNGTLREIKRLNKDDSVPVEMASGATPTPGGDLTLLQEFFSNVGRLRPSAGGLGK